jgi:hypothetical protein
MNLNIFKKTGTGLLSNDFVIDEQNELSQSMKTDSEFSSQKNSISHSLQDNDEIKSTLS